MTATYPDLGWFHPCRLCGCTLLGHPAADSARHVVIEASGRIASRVRCKAESEETRPTTRCPACAGIKVQCYRRRPADRWRSRCNDCGEDMSCMEWQAASGFSEPPLPPVGEGRPLA